MFGLWSGRTLRCISRPVFKMHLSQSVATKPVSTPSMTSTASRQVGIWMAGCSGMVAGAVLLGGITRLTESGLSMVDWKLLKDMKPPANQAEWETEFEKYKTFPEFAVVHSDFELADFKRIYYMEYAHRMWGRLIGLGYFIPLAFFLSKQYIPKADLKRHAVFSVLLLAQGAYGWYMVKSGLESPEKPQNDIPRVSQYRLAGHLGLAFLLYSGFFWNSMSLLKKQVEIQPSVLLKPFRILTHISKFLVFTTAISGAFVAGLDAGLIYNSFPKMANSWIPPETLSLSPKWKNFFENPSCVQLDHRVLGMSTFSAISCVWVLSSRLGLPKRVNRASNALFGMVCLQVSMGIGALLYYVPIWLASAHQCGSLATLSAALWLSHDLKGLKKVVRRIK